MVSTRQAILTAATDLVQTVGANAMSFQDLAERTGIRKASVHHHFATKTDLLDEVMRAYSEGYFALVGKTLATDQSAFNKLCEIVGLYAQTCERDGGGRRACVAGMLGSEVGTLSDTGRLHLASFVERNEQTVEDLIRSGGVDGSIRPPPVPRDYARSLIAALQGCLLLARVSGGPTYFRRVIGPMIEMVRA